MNNILKMENFIGIKEDSSNVLGKFLYFSLSNVLIERGKLSEICLDTGLPISPGNRIGAIDAFKSATGDIYDRIVKKENGELKISKVYCRDNQKCDNIYSRELVKETLGETTNRYRKLANLYYNRDSESIDYNIESFDSDLDVSFYCDKAVDLFEVYKACAGRNQIETVTEKFLNAMESLPISIHGQLFFIPRKHMHYLTIFEDFIDAISANNKRKGQLTVNSMYVVDDEKQRDKMAAEFYNDARKEIELYTEKVEYLISSGSQSPAVMDRWILKITKLEAKKQHYEEILKRDLSELDDSYSTLKFLANELSLRVNKLRIKKCA